MIRIGLAVEGDTEVRFIKRVVSLRYYDYNCYFQPVDMNGNVSIDRLTSEMFKLGYNFDAVTSLVDFYGFKCKGDKSAVELEDEVKDRLAEKLGRRFDEQSVFPYVQIHEFEGLLFSDVKPFGRMFDGKDLVGELQAMRDEFESPEDINDSKHTAPSKRLEKAIPGYHKNLYGARLAAAMGLACIRAQCPRFDRWMAHIDRLVGI